LSEQRKAETVMVRCSDHRLARVCEDFLENDLAAPRGSYDLVVVPGGPQFLCAVDYLPKFLWVGRRWMSFLVDAHEIRRAVLISHQDCGWYRQVHGVALTGERKEERQKQDLRQARSGLLKFLPQLEVRAFFARLHSPSADVTFEEVLP
jgi:hypothetical protein